MTTLEVVPLPCDREVTEGDDLASLVLEACTRSGVTLEDGDVLCVAQKVVSKAEGAVISAPAGDDVHAIRRRVAAEQAVRVVADSPWVLVVETHHGLVCANAGVDASNLPDGTLALLPEDPDGAAAWLRRSLEEATGARLGVIVTDTFGRPWRLGQTEVAIGASGVNVIRDERGDVDRFGHALEVTEAAIADELAGAADLVRRKADGTPFVLIRGADAMGEGRARDLVRPSDEDLFRVGGPVAVLAGLRDDDTLSPPAPEAVVRTIAEQAQAAAGHLEDGVHVEVAGHGHEALLVFEVAGGADLVAAGAMLAAARIAAHTSGWATRWEPVDEDDPQPRGAAGRRTLGVLRVGRASPGDVGSV